MIYIFEVLIFYIVYCVTKQKTISKNKKIKVSFYPIKKRKFFRDTLNKKIYY